MKIIINTFVFLIPLINSFGTQTCLSKWRGEFLNAVRSESLPPNIMIRNLALFSASVHDAINSLEKKYKPYYIYHSHKLKIWDLQSVVAGCGINIGTNLHPARAVKFENLAPNINTQIKIWNKPS